MCCNRAAAPRTTGTHFPNTGQPWQAPKEAITSNEARLRRPQRHNYVASPGASRADISQPDPPAALATEVRLT